MGCSAGMAALVLSALPPAATPLSAPLMPALLYTEKPYHMEHPIP